MNANQNPPNRLAAFILPLARAPKAKGLWMVCAAGALWFYPNACLSVLGNLLHFVVGWLETGVKVLLQGLFGLSHRTAQVIVAWGGLILVLVATLYGGRRFWLHLKALTAAMQSAAALAVAVLSIAHRGNFGPRAALAVGSLGIAWYWLV
jgi:hypothetical protein